MAALSQWPATNPAQNLAAPGDGWDPLLRYLHVDEVSNLRLSGMSTTRYWQSVNLQESTMGSFMQGIEADVTAYHQGGQPVLPVDRSGAPIAFDPANGEPAGEVAGQPAYWTSGYRAQFEAEVLAWQWEPGAWALVTTWYFDESEPAPAHERQLLRSWTRNVAPAVTIGAGNPVTMPFTMAPPPAPARLLGTGVLYLHQADSEPLIWAQLTFGTVDNRTPLRSVGDDPYTFNVNANTVDKAGEKGIPKDRINGHQAQIGTHRVHV